MAYTPPDKDEILQTLIAGVQSDLPELDVSEGSPEWHMLNNIAHAVAAAMGNSKALAQAVNPLYSKLANLSTLAGLWGLTRNPATGAEGGNVGVNVTTGSGSWLITQQFRSPDGLTYQATSAGSWSAAGTVAIPIDAVSTGAATTKVIGSALTVLSPPAGMASTGSVAGSFTTPGYDEETDEELRQRLLNLLQGQGNSGNRGDYIRWMEEVTGVAEGYIYTELRNSLSLDGTIFGPKTVPGQRFFSMASVVTDVEDYINGTALVEGQRAVGQDFDCEEPTAVAQTMYITIDSDPNYGRDWGTAATTELTIVSIDATTLTAVTVSDSPFTQNLAVGHRIAINTGVIGGGGLYYHNEVRTVTNIVTSAPNWIIYVDTAFSSATPGPSKVRPAGPTTEATVTAIEALMDSLTPADDANGSRWPIVSAENPTDLTEARINRAVLGVEVDEVLRHWDVTITTPGALPVVPAASAISGGVLVANVLRLDTLRINYNTLNDQ
jgi:uncharacterized phage protein gp47/JayE